MPASGHLPLYGAPITFQPIPLIRNIPGFARKDPHPPGMPAKQSWEFEDAVVDLGSVTPAPEDLDRLLAVDFATVLGE